ncbi:MAG TPA: thiamine phosphate synthase, partial [Pyrinomonadaceae bacterium]|nr:thiamine phosphate synthase [Pyrinomonadaceae bacterium]
MIYLITDGELTVENYAESSRKTLELIKRAVAAKISLIQIREKQIPAKSVFEFALQAAQITKKSKTKLLINDRADIALAANADGVHLTANSLSAKVIRKNFPKNFIIGVSAHSLEKAEIAKNQGADFATFSPIFHSPNKGKSVGLEVLREVCKKLKPFPIIALGGIDRTN